MGRSSCPHLPSHCRNTGLHHCAPPCLRYVSSRAQTLVLKLAKLALYSLSLVWVFTAVAHSVAQADLGSAVLLRPSLTTVGITVVNLHARCSLFSSLFLPSIPFSWKSLGCCPRCGSENWPLLMVLPLAVPASLETIPPHCSPLSASDFG